MSARLEREDVREIESWADEIVEQASDWAERAEINVPGGDLARALDALARAASNVRALARVSWLDEEQQ